MLKPQADSEYTLDQLVRYNGMRIGECREELSRRYNLRAGRYRSLLEVINAMHRIVIVDDNGEPDDITQDITLVLDLIRTMRKCRQELADSNLSEDLTNKVTAVMKDAEIHAGRILTFVKRAQDDTSDRVNPSRWRLSATGTGAGTGTGTGAVAGAGAGAE